MATKQTQNGKSGSKLLLWKKNVQVSEPVNYGMLDAIVLRRTIDAITRAGGAIMLGVTSDGGAYSCVVLHGDAKIKEYPHSVEELSNLFEQLTDEFTE